MRRLERSCEQLGGPEPRAARTPVLAYLVGGGRHDLAGEDADAGRRPAAASRQRRRTNALRGPGLERALHPPVLERMVGDDHEPPRRAQPVERTGEKTIEVVELLVDSDAQSLEETRRRMDAAAAI